MAFISEIRKSRKRQKKCSQDGDTGKKIGWAKATTGEGGRGGIRSTGQNIGMCDVHSWLGWRGGGWVGLESG